jgi:hypothetical protein
MKNKFYGVFIANHSRTHKTELTSELNDTEEKWYVVASQVFIPFMIAGFGMVAAGLVLERVKVFF